MQTWLVYALITLFLWGIYGFLPKVTIPYMSPTSAIVFQAAGAVIVAAVVLIFGLQFKPELNPKGIMFAILTGITGVTGALFFLAALSNGGKNAVVIAITALYPLISIALSMFILKETITLIQGTGIILALVAILLILL